MRKKKLPLLEKIEITDLGAKGKSIAKIDDFVTFVSGGLPGDIADIQLTRRRKSYQEGRVVKIHQFSDKRVEPFCKHFRVCGGCRWQDLKYPEQLFYKNKEVTDTLERVGKLDLPPAHPIMASEKEIHYRNKLEFTFSNRRWLSEEEVRSGEDFGERDGLGFHVPGMFDKVVDLEECFLQPEPSNSIRQAVREYAREKNLGFFDLKNGGGLLRNLIIRNTLSGEVMVILVFYEDEPDAGKDLLEFLESGFPQITSLMYCINRKANDTIADQEILLHSGRDHIIERMEDLQFKIGPKSFFQTNSLQALELYRRVREFAGLQGNEILYDLYTGTGTIALFLAASAAKVIGIEYIEDAIRNASVNAEINGIGNAHFFSGDIKDVLSREFIDREGQPDVLVTDPPRAGMHADVVDAILYAAPERIVYVSCNPATQARDLQLLSDSYRVLEVQPVDMFPHTYHVENIVKLEKK
jgi:23S rRNA (uracil1939-C5)-methyltransferase